VQACRLYYELGETQERIAEILRVTRPQVSRMLKEARAEGIVEIRVIDTASRSAELTQALCERFNLHSVHLAPRLAGPSDLTRRMIGRVAANVLRDHLRDGHLVGVGGGMTIAAVADAFADTPTRYAITVVPLAGGGMSAPSRDPVRRIAELLGGYAMEVFAPGIVHDRIARHAILSSANARNVTNAWAQLDVAVFGVGAYLRSETWFGADVVAEVEAAGAVGEILIRPFDIDGNFVVSRLNELVVGLDPHELGRVPVSIAAAGGPDKVEPVLGILRARVANVLVTDEVTAADVLELDDAQRRGRATDAQARRRAPDVDAQQDGRGELDDGDATRPDAAASDSATAEGGHRAAGLSDG